jgi:acyl transferase domain-containing protein
MAKSLIFMFSGQGSHYYQMGRALYEQHTVFHDCLEQADKIIKDELGQSLLAEGIYPAKVLGTSLEELVAAAVAGVINWETGLLMLIDCKLKHYFHFG